MWAFSDSTRRKLESIGDSRVTRAMLMALRVPVNGRVDKNSVRSVACRLLLPGEGGMRVLRRLVVVGLGAWLLAPSAASAASNVYAANYGSGGTVSQFSIGSGGALAQVGTGVVSGASASSKPGEVAASPDGQHLYVSNYMLGTVSTFSLGSGGALTQVGTGVQSGSSTSSEPYGVAASPNSSYVYVANEGLGTVSTFSVGAGGTLTQVGTGVQSGSSASSMPAGVAVSPSASYVYVTNEGQGTVSTFSVGAGGALTQQGAPVSTGSGSGSEPGGVAVSPNGQNLYVANYGQGTVSTFSIGSGGALTQQGTGVISGASAGSEPYAVAVSPSSAYLYVPNFGLGTVSTFSIGGGGALTQQGTGVASGSGAGSEPAGVALAPNSSSLYVANYGLGTVSTFSIGSGGALTQQGTGVISGASASSGPIGVVVTPDQGPSAAYSATVGRAGSPSAFNAQASTGGSAPIMTYSWQLGDGGTATGPQVSHVYANPGTYTVTLALTDTDFCSVLGPFTGHSAYCASDPAASTSQTITVPAPVLPAALRPTASHESITGVAKRKPKLAFTVAAGKNAPALKTIAVSLPGGLSFSSKKKSLAHDITLKGANGKRLKFTAKLSHGVLTITLGAAAAKAQVTIASPELSASKSLAKKVKKSKAGKRHKPVKLSFKLAATDAHHTTTRLTLKLSAS
jgi:DNA-binding beta-propeller fold protein YncE